MPETLSSSPQESGIGSISGRIDITRWLVMAAIAVGSYFAVASAKSDIQNEEDIAVLQPKGGSGIPKSGFAKADKTESEDGGVTAGNEDNPEKKAIKTHLNIREKYKPENVCYVGDSYIKGITSEGEVELNIFAKNGRPFVSRGGKWDGEDINTFILQTLENPDCKLIVMNGGLNDFYSYHRRLNEVISGLKEAYENIMRIAKEKGIEVIIFNVPKIPKLPMDMDENTDKRLRRKNEINETTDKFNQFLLTLEGPHVMDTMAILQSVCQKNDECRIWRKDGIHPGPKGYRALFRSL
jgi:hypothetical protein